MEKKMVRFSGFVGLILVIVSLVVLGCQSPPPAQTPPPPASTAQTPPPAATVPTPAPAAAPSQDSSQIQVGMTGEQVQQIMGAPGQIEQKGAMTEWKYYTPQGKVEVKLQNNKVAFVERGH